MSFEYFREWCLDKIINISVVFLFLMFVLFIIVVATVSSGFKGYTASASNVALSNKKIEWGIQRGKNHEQPNLGDYNKRVIEEFDGLAIGTNQKPYVYLTFDVGYEGGYTEKILDILKENQVNATFFVTGQFVKTSPRVIERMILEKQIIGNHTVNHISMPNSNDEKVEQEIMDLHKMVYDNFDYEMKYMRPPKGEYSEKNLAIVQKMGYVPVMWSFAYDDWDDNKQGREEYGKKKIMDNLHNGEIILLHATSKDNANILGSVIKEIKRQGYEFKSLDEFER